VADPIEALDRFQLRAHARLLRAAVVLFGKKPSGNYPQCQLRLARFKGIDKTEFLDNRQVQGHAFGLLDEAMHFILRNIPIAGRIESAKLERTDTLSESDGLLGPRLKFYLWQLAQTHAVTIEAAKRAFMPGKEGGTEDEREEKE